MDINNIPLQSRVRIDAVGQSYTGILLPREGEVVVLKLDNGYNIGLKPKHIKNIEVLEKEDKEKVSPAPIEQDNKLPTIKILHTGGTIASRVDYETGGVIADFKPESLLRMFPELTKIANIESEFLGNMWSDDFRFSHFNKISNAILESARHGVKSFIVTSGTDFLHYLSAALSFQLRNMPVSVLVVGSQRSSDRGSSDSGMNLICAAQFLATTNFKGVGVCMHASTNDDICAIYKGVNVRKMHSSRRDAFKPINSRPWATVDYEKKTVNLISAITPRSGELPANISQYDEMLKIGMLYSRPQLYAEEFMTYEKYDGLVLVGSGLGQFPVTKVDDKCEEHEKILDVIEILAKKMPLVMSTQTIYGGVHMNVYAPARKLQEAGVLGHGSSMTPETTYIKLAWLLSSEASAEKIMENLVGELDVNRADEFY